MPQAAQLSLPASPPSKPPALPELLHCSVVTSSSAAKSGALENLVLVPSFLAAGRFPAPNDAQIKSVCPCVRLNPTLPDSTRAEATKRASASFIFLLLFFLLLSPLPAPAPECMIYYWNVAACSGSADRSPLNLEASEPAACAWSHDREI